MVIRPINICTNLLVDSLDKQFFDIEILLIIIIEMIIPSIKNIVIHSLVNGVQSGKFIKKIIIRLSKWQ